MSAACQLLSLRAKHLCLLIGWLCDWSDYILKYHSLSVSISFFLGIEGISHNFYLWWFDKTAAAAAAAKDAGMSYGLAWSMTRAVGLYVLRFARWLINLLTANWRTIAGI